MPRAAAIAPLPIVIIALAGCLPPLPAFVTCEEVDACSTGSTSGDEQTPTTSAGVFTVTGDPQTSGSTSSDPASSDETTDEPAAPPQIVDGVVIPNYIADNGVLAVSTSTLHADGVRLLLDSGKLTELTPGRPGEFTGQITAFTALDNGKHTAVLTPWRDMLVGDSVEVEYVIALPPPAHESRWELDGRTGNVAAIAVLPDGRPVELGTYQQDGEPRCYLHLRDRHGASVESIDLLAPAYCRAVDLKIDRDTGRMHMLVERQSGNETLWWVGEISSWGKGPKNIGTGTVGDTALALAARPDVVAVCGSRAVATMDKLDALAVLLRPGKPAEARLFDYQPPKDVANHKFAETARDCTFAGDTLVMVGETRGPHDGKNYSRDRLTVLESAIIDANPPTWTVAGPSQGIQTRALALDLDLEGAYHLTGYSCADTCEPTGELWTYAPGGKLVDHTLIGPLGSPWFGPHDIAWSPAGYAVVALGDQLGDNPVFKVQAFAPGDPLPLWTFLPLDQQGLQLALAVAVGPYGEVYAGGIGDDDHPAFARIGG